ncbi:MAG: hypothetical protein WA691_04150 [Thermoplasmata archaeon]
MNRRAGDLMAYAITLVVVAILVSEVAVYAPPLRNSVSFSVSLEETGSSIEVNSQVTTSYSGTFQQVGFWLNSSSEIRTIYYFYDAAYGLSFSNIISWAGMQYYLQLAIAARGLPISVVVVDADQLERILSNPLTAPGGLLVVASGAFPSTVYSNSSDLVAPWLLDGGRLAWIGAAIGYYSASANTPLSSAGSVIGTDGVHRFLGNLSYGPVGPLVNSTDGSLALNIASLTYALTGFGLSTAGVAAAGGQVYGNVAGGLTNAALLPFGAGSVMDFSLPLIEGTEQMIGNAVINMIQVGGAFPSTTLVQVSTHTVAAGTTSSWTATTGTGPSQAPGGPWSYCVFTEQTDVSALFGTSTCLPSQPGAPSAPAVGDGARAGEVAASFSDRGDAA